MQPGKVISVFKSVHTYNSGNKRKKCSSKTIWKIKIFYNATIKTQGFLRRCFQKLTSTLVLLIYFMKAKVWKHKGIRMDQAVNNEKSLALCIGIFLPNLHFPQHRFASKILF